MIDDTDIKYALSDLNPVSLNELNSVSLMDRVEIKYVFPVYKMSSLIRLMRDKYRVLEINDTRTLPYNTTYLDTSDYIFYNQHTRGELARHKIRYRKYEINGDSFLEIKIKTNKRRTVKWRIENTFEPGIYDKNAEDLICMHLPVRSSMLSPSLVNRFNRITVIGKETDERITLDYNIDFTDPENDTYTELPYLGVIEMKKLGYSQCSPFNSIAKSLNIYPEGFSKYCTGNAILKNGLKTNMVKQKILLLNKIENEHIKSCSN